MVYGLSRQYLILGVLLCSCLFIHYHFFFRTYSFLSLAYVYGLQDISGPLNLPQALLPSILGGYFKFGARRLSPLLFEFEYLCRHRTLFLLNGVNGGPQLAYLRRPRLLSRLVLGDGVIV